MKPGAVDIRKAVCVRFAIGPAWLNGPSKKPRVTMPRQIAMYLTSQMTDLSLLGVARAFGRTNHTTVFHANERISQAIETDAEMAEYVSQCRGMAIGFAEERLRNARVNAARAAAGELFLANENSPEWGFPADVSAESVAAE